MPGVRIMSGNNIKNTWVVFHIEGKSVSTKICIGKDYLRSDNVTYLYSTTINKKQKYRWKISVFHSKCDKRVGQINTYSRSGQVKGRGRYNYLSGRSFRGTDKTPSLHPLLTQSPTPPRLSSPFSITHSLPDSPPYPHTHSPPYILPLSLTHPLTLTHSPRRWGIFHWVWSRRRNSRGCNSSRC